MGRQTTSFTTNGWSSSLSKWIEVGGGRGREHQGREQQKVPKLTFLQIPPVPHGREAGERFFFPSCISKETVISHLSDTQKLISELDFNWGWEQLTNYPSPSPQFAPVSPSSLIYFLICSPCFATVSPSAPRLPLAPTEFRESSRISHVSLGGDAQAACRTTGTSIESLQRPPRLRREDQVRGPGWHASSLPPRCGHRRNGAAKAEETSGRGAEPASREEPSRRLSAELAPVSTGT